MVKRRAHGQYKLIVFWLQFSDFSFFEEKLIFESESFLVFFYEIILDVNAGLLIAGVAGLEVGDFGIQGYGLGG